MKRTYAPVMLGFVFASLVSATEANSQTPTGRGGTFPLMSCNTERGTLTDVSGTDSRNAVARGIITKDDLKEYCGRTLPYLLDATPTVTQIEQCANKRIGELRKASPDGTKLVSTADCGQRIIRTPSKQAYQIVGVVRDASLNEFSWKDLQSGRTTDQSCSAGTIPAAEQFKLLCPDTARQMLEDALNDRPSGGPTSLGTEDERLSKTTMQKAGSFPLASCKSWNGTIIERSGVDGRNATIRGTVTRDDLLEYCSRSPGGEVKNIDDIAEVERCADGLLLQLRNSVPDRTKLISIADCRQGTIRDTEERAYQLVGSDPSTAWNDLRWKHLRSNQLLDSSCASGTPPITEQFKLLCPSAAKTALAASVAKPAPDAHIGLWYSGNDVQVCRQKHRVGRDEPSLVYYSKQGMKELMATCHITRSNVRQEGLFVSLRCKHLEGDTYLHEELLEVNNESLIRKFNGANLTYRRCPEVEFSLVQALSVGKWTVNSPANCTNAAKIYSLIPVGANVIWKGGTGSVNEERVTFVDSSTLVTVTARSTSGTATGTNWTYKQSPNGSIQVSTTGKKDFTLVPCSNRRLH